MYIQEKGVYWTVKLGDETYYDWGTGTKIYMTKVIDNQVEMVTLDSEGRIRNQKDGNMVLDAYMAYHGQPESGVTFFKLADCTP